jgi:hypothetical protein
MFHVCAKVIAASENGVLTTPNAPGELRPTRNDAEEAEKSLLGGPSAAAV